MGFFNWMKALFEAQGDREAHWVHVHCDQCGEALRTRVDLAHDLTARYDSTGQVEGYFTRKMIIGSGKCFNQIEVEIEFDPSRQPLTHEVHGGELISEDEYQEALPANDDNETSTTGR